MSETPGSHVSRADASGKRVPNPNHEVCLACSSPSGSDALFCPRCGTAIQQAADGSTAGALASGDSRVPDTSPPPAEAASVNHAEPLKADVPPVRAFAPRQREAKCACGQLLSPAVKFCQECGAKAPPPASELQLVLFDQNRAPVAAHPLGDQTTIGKSEQCDLVIPDDDYVSREHARIYRDKTQIFLEDAKSSNGTYLRLSRPIVLHPDDVIVIGSSVFRLESTPSDAG